MYVCVCVCVSFQLREVGRKFRSLHDSSKKECEKVKDELKEEKEKATVMNKENEELKKKLEEMPAQSEAATSLELEDKNKVQVCWHCSLRPIHKITQGLALRCINHPLTLFSPSAHSAPSLLV